MTVSCPHCVEDIELDDPFSLLGKVQKCINCGHTYELHYDSIWNPEIEDSASFFYTCKEGEDS